jgi:hypothetical protein
MDAIKKAATYIFTFFTSSHGFRNTCPVKVRWDIDELATRGQAELEIKRKVQSLLRSTSPEKMQEYYDAGELALDASSLISGDISTDRAMQKIENDKENRTDNIAKLKAMLSRMESEDDS